MFASYLYPGYRFASYGYGYPVAYGYPTWGGYGGYGGYGYGSNIIGSAIANNNLINTGTATGISQVANPVSIWG